MTIVDRLKAFLFRKRRWQWLAVGIALVALGQYLEAQKIEPSSMALQGQQLTMRLHDRLAALQPGAIADLYARAGRGRHGIGWCGPTAAAAPLTLDPKPHLERRYGATPADLQALRDEAARRRALSSGAGADPIGNVMAPLEREVGLPDPRGAADRLVTGRRSVLTDPRLLPRQSPVQLNVNPDTDRLRALLDREGLGKGRSVADAIATMPKAPASRCSGGWAATADSAVLNLRLTPEIAWVVWREGGWSTTILLALTLAGMVALILAVWTQKDIGLAAVPITLFVLALGPVIAGGVFWLMLQLLLGLTAVLGHVFAGLALVLAWIAGLLKIVMIGVETLTKTDEAKENFDALKASLGGEPPPAD